MYITNLLKKVLGYYGEYCLCGKQEIMWFWYKAYNVYIVRMHVKYL